MALQYVLCSRNKKKLIDNGSLFVRERTTGLNTIWKCDKVYTTKCRARVHTIKNLLQNELESTIMLAVMLGLKQLKL